MLRVGIIGSCVTRDIFSMVDAAADAAKVVRYTARTTIRSMLAAAPDPETRAAWAPTDPKFAQRVVREDLNKQFMAGFSGLDAVIVDLIDERHRTIRQGDAIVSRSVGFDAAVPKIPDGWDHQKPLDPDVVAETLALIPRWVEAVSAATDGAPIILHRAPWAARQLHADGTTTPNREAGRWNQVLNAYYDAIEVAASFSWPAVAFEREVSSWAEHKWGQAPFHYTHDYYVSMWSMIRDRIVMPRCREARYSMPE